MTARFALSVVAIVLIVGAAVTLGVAVASQRHAPQPATTAAGSIGQRLATDPLPGPASSTPAPSSTTEALPPVLAPSQPVSVTIPAIDVHSALQVLGLNPDGSLQVPQPGPHYNQAAWCRCSPTPGERGPSVILGHVDSAAEGESVFFRLGALKPGDTVSVARADGITANFRITGVRRFPKDQFPTALVYSNTPNAQLRLITCGGGFDHATGHYVDNIVVFATLLPPAAT